MSNVLQVCLYNAEQESSEPLRQSISQLNFVRLVAEASTPEHLATALNDAGVQLVFFHMDPDPAPVIDLIDQVSQRFPEVALIAFSHDAGPEAILAPIRAGCDQFVCEPIDHSELAAAVSRVASRRFLSRAKSRCICVTGASGGAGTTSIACNLAMEIAHLSEKPCSLADLDLQFGDVAINFDVEPQYTFHDVAVAGSDVDSSMIESILTRLPCGITLLARPNVVEQCEIVTSDVIHRAIELLTSIHENVVVDVPRRIDHSSFAALSQADLVLIVCQLSVPSMRNASRYADSLAKLGIPEERIEIVANRGDSSGGRVTVKDLEGLIRKPVYACIPNDFQFVARSLDFGRPIAALDRNNPVRAEIRKVARGIVVGSDPEAAAKPARRGLLGRLLFK